MIFMFSAQDADASSQTSTGVLVWLMHILYPDYDHIPPVERRALFYRYHNLARKVAHVTEFAMLGTFLYLFLHGVRVRWAALLSWLGGTLYAASDELHQTVVSGRGGMWQDVCIDSGGVVIGILLGVALLGIFHWAFGKRPEMGKP